MTTRLPGASDVFTQGFTLSPSSTARLATSPARDQHRGIRRVRARRDRRDDDRALAQRLGHLLAVHLFGLATEGVAEGAARARERHAVLGPLRSREARLDGREVQFDVLGVDRFARASGRARGPAPWRRPRRGRAAPWRDR